MFVFGLAHGGSTTDLHWFSASCEYCDLVYKFKGIVGRPKFSDQLKNIIKRYKKKLDILNINITQQSAYLVVNLLVSSFFKLVARWIRPQTQ